MPFPPHDQLTAVSARLCPEMIDVVVDSLVRGGYTRGLDATRAYVAEHARHVTVPWLLEPQLSLPYLADGAFDAPSPLRRAAREDLKQYIERVRVRLVRLVHNARAEFVATYGSRSACTALPQRVVEFVRAGWPWERADECLLGEALVVAETAYVSLTPTTPETGARVYLPPSAVEQLLVTEDLAAEGGAAVQG